MMRRLPQNGQSGAVVLYFVLFLLVVSALTAAYQRLVLPAMTVGVASRTLVVRQACLDSARAAAEAAFGKTCIKDGDVECSNFKKDAVVTVTATAETALPCGGFKIKDTVDQENGTSVTVSFDLSGSTFVRTFLIPKQVKATQNSQPKVDE